MSTRQRIMNEMAKMSKKLNNPNAVDVSKRRRWNILRGDRVQVVGRHPDKGKQGIVLEVLRTNDRVIVQGINMGTVHVKGDPNKGTKGQKMERERSIHYSNVNLVDPVTGFATRISRRILEDGTKVRIAKRSGAVIPRPEILTLRKKPLRQVVTDKDTTDDDVWEESYVP